MDQVERPTLPPAAARINDNNKAGMSATANPPHSSSSSSSSSSTAPFEDTLLRWLTSSDHAPPDGTGSIVALLYDVVGNADCLRTAVDDHLPADFQTFLFTTSLAHTGWRSSSPSPIVTHRDLCIAGHVCGSRIVRRLDRVLTPQFLAKCNRITHRALLLLVFGVILGVSYSTRLTTSPSFPHDLLGNEMRHSPTLWLAMKEHLAQMLAHHLIFLGSTLGIKLDTAAEKIIIDTAVDRWNKPERSLWAGLDGWAAPGSRGGDPNMGNMMTARSFGTNLGISMGRGGFGSMDGLENPHAQQQQQHQQQLLLQPFSHQDPHVSSLPGSPQMPGGSSASKTATSMMSMVALSDPDLLELQTVPPMSEDDYSTNPESFYDMAYVHGDRSRDNSELSLSQAPEMMHTDLHTDLHADTSSDMPSSMSTDLDELQRERPGNPGGGQPQTRKKRSVWIVRPYDDGGSREPVSVFARFELQRGQNLGLFV